MANMKEKGCTTLQTKVDSTKETFSTTKCMATARKFGQTVESTKETTETLKKTGSGPSYGQTATCTRATGETTNRTEKGCTST